MDLLWNSYEPPNEKANEPPLDIYFRRAEVVLMRSAWTDLNALFVGFKAGDNKANHSHLDLGSFVLDAIGERWIVDLGAENYNIGDYFNTGKGGKRWTYYRTRAEGHNTLVFNPSEDPGQDPLAETRIIKFNSDASGSYAIADLTPAYKDYVTSVRRGISMPDRKRVIIRDEVQAGQNTEVNWFVHTPAKITLDADGRKATLVLNDKKMEVRILAPAKATFSILDPKPLPTSPHPEGVNENKGISKLAITMKSVRSENIEVEFRPASEKSSYKGTMLKPLASW